MVLYLLVTCYQTTDRLPQLLGHHGYMYRVYAHVSWFKLTPAGGRELAAVAELGQKGQFKRLWKSKAATEGLKSSFFGKLELS